MDQAGSGPSPNGSLDGSVSSSSGTDLATKYSKVCSEYAKLRAQFGILKTAVRQEQDKSHKVEDQLRDKELKERKMEAEMESIKFRNQQLTKRIQVLQEDMESMDLQLHHKKHQKHKDRPETSLASEQLNSVMGQELQSKIEENARLHAKLSDIDKKYEDVITAQNSRIRELEFETKRTAQSSRAKEMEQKELLHGFKEEKVALLGHVKSLEKELVDAQDRITVLTVQLESTSDGSPQHLAKCAPSSSNSIPLSAKEVHIHSVELLSGFSDHVTDITAALSDLHTYWEHRLKDTHFDGPLTDNAARLSSLLLQNVKHLKPVETAFQELLSNVLSRKSKDRQPIIAYVKPFAETFKAYVDYACGLEALTVACLQHESNLPSCPQSQQSKNDQISSGFRALNRTLVRLSDYLSRLEGKSPEADIENLENITVVLSELLKCVSELNALYGAKASDENQLPTVTDQLKNTNMCIVNAYSNLQGAVNSLTRMLSDTLTRIKTLIQTGNEVALLPEPEEDESSASPAQRTPAKVRAEKALEHQSKLDSLHKEKETLTNTVLELQDKLMKAEQNREHWKLECQLLQMKADKLKSSQGETDQDKLFSEREAEIQKPFRQRIEELISERMLADSKATSFYLECVCLKQRLKHSESVKNQVEKELSAAQEQVSAIHEEKSLVSSNYEIQLAMMTEHVANMNEKLTKKSDEIEGLKYELKAKKGAK